MENLTVKRNKIPQTFQGILWSYDFSKIDPEADKKIIIINAINYGDWEHWRWIFNYYGIAEVKKVIENTPVSEFRQRAFKLIRLLLKIKKIKYETRGIKIRAEKNI